MSVPVDVIHWATLNGADIVGMSHELGTVELANVQHLARVALENEGPGLPVGRQRHDAHLIGGPAEIVRNRGDQRQQLALFGGSAGRSPERECGNDAQQDHEDPRQQA